MARKIRQAINKEHQLRATQKKNLLSLSIKGLLVTLTGVCFYPQHQTEILKYMGFFTLATLVGLYDLYHFENTPKSSLKKIL